LSVDEAIRRLKAVQHRLFALFVERRQERDPMMPTRLQSHVLESVRQEGELSTSEVATLLHISVPTASQLVNTMVERGWLMRITESADRRRHPIRLTPEGERLLDQRSQERMVEITRVLTALSAEERTHLVRLAERIQMLWTAENEGTSGHETKGGTPDGNR
jgi:DNA-binding MarR family transcriptional regulator